ncbi:hypothetical protein F2Q68_00013358 [Brassica cretica]|uniref:Uncharacterized protein n=1 Tax=Brassica cretica TaxID=69181 RepID=A0A8S9HCH1_BRACR|nr:hypothetical protein F2Q68_00013358 [Brassica cretica]
MSARAIKQNTSLGRLKGPSASCHWRSLLPCCIRVDENCVVTCPMLLLELDRRIVVALVWLSMLPFPSISDGLAKHLSGGQYSVFKHNFIPRIFHINTFSFGAQVPDHTCFCHSNVVEVEESKESWESIPTGELKERRSHKVS